MDDIVKAAIAKWPNVPACYGWLALDARGNWRMRDARCQALNLPGDIIRHPSLLSFINRNYQHDDKGQWYFQNGPQKVYVDLAATPYIARTSATGFTLHTGDTLPLPDAAFFNSEGNLILRSNTILAQLDDRDLAEVSGYLYENKRLLNDDEFMKWLEQTNQSNSDPQLMWHYQGKSDYAIPVAKNELADLMLTLGFQSHPAADHPSA